MTCLKLSDDQSSVDSNEKIRLKIAVHLTLGTLFACLLIILFIIGGYIYDRQRPLVLTYTNGMCEVQNISFKSATCTSRFSSYECYDITWKVVHGENQTINATITEYSFRTISDVDKKMNEYQMNSTYICWYNTKKPPEAQWKQPETRTAIILLICGAISIIPTIIFLYIGCRYIKSYMRQGNNDSSKMNNVTLLKMNPSNI